MCLALHKPKGIKLDKKYYEEAFRRNPDGGGFAYVGEAKHGKMLIEDKGFFKTEDFIAAIQAVEEAEMIIHFRRASCGGVSLEMCHPFTWDCPQFSEYSFAVIHNGHLLYRSEAKKSDTACFVEDILRPHLSRDPWFLDSKSGMWMLDEIIGYNNKMVIMRYNAKKDETDTYIINQDAGVEELGCWFSNSSHKAVVPITYPGYGGGMGCGWDGYDDSPRGPIPNPTTQHGPILRPPAGPPRKWDSAKGKWDYLNLDGWSFDKNKRKWTKTYPASTAAGKTASQLALGLTKAEEKQKKERKPVVSMIALVVARHLQAMAEAAEEEDDTKDGVKADGTIYDMDGKPIATIPSASEWDDMTESDWKAYKAELAKCEKVTDELVKRGFPAKPEAPKTLEIVVVPEKPKEITVPRDAETRDEKKTPPVRGTGINHLRKTERKAYIKHCVQYLLFQNIPDVGGMTTHEKVLWIREDVRGAIDELNDLSDEQLDGWILTEIADLEQEFKNEVARSHLTKEAAENLQKEQLAERTEALRVAQLTH